MSANTSDSTALSKGWSSDALGPTRDGRRKRALARTPRRPGGLQDGPRALQNAPKSAPGRFQERPIGPWKPPLSRPSLFNSSNTPPRGLQDASGASLGPFGASPRLLQKPPRAPERHPRTPRRDLPEASASKPPSIQDLSLCFYALLGQGPSVHHPRPGGMREAIE